MHIIESIPVLRETLKNWRGQGETIAFVPTMGNLHAGHVELVEQAKSQASRVVVSVFVNPTQFGPGEDFAAYPRTPEEDAAKLRAAGVDVLLMPPSAEVYPQGSLTFVEVASVSDILCGAFRPGHFRGVATVVCKLFNMVQPDVALFGEKDWQQLAIIRRMVADLNLPLRVVGVPTVREDSGLAMSSRNGYLSEAEKQQAAWLYQSLLAARAALQSGRRDYAQIEAEQAAFLRGAGFAPDYFAVLKPDLSEPSGVENEWVVLVAARLGKARLIDNLSVSV
jgi:pantoate--beta-alanine ligase